jgi:hypothetical protein
MRCGPEIMLLHAQTRENLLNIYSEVGVEGGGK